jgi:hypothetical protein
MMKLLCSLLLIWLLPLLGNSQSLQWERVLDFSSGINSFRISDIVRYIAVQDTNTFFCSAICGDYGTPSPAGSMYFPTVLAFNSNGSIIDTIVFNDSTLTGQSFCLDRTRKRIWVAYRTDNYPYTRTVIEKINFRGFSIVRRDFRGPDRIDSLPATIYKLLPASDGGFYMLGGRTRVINGQNTEPWQVSRFDSLGNRRWVKEYLYTYAFGNPTGGEFLPNGNLFVNGWAGREIYGIEIDTATGNTVNRKVFFIHPDNAGWFFSSINRAADGYIVTGYDSRNNSTNVNRYFFGKYNDTLGLVWGAMSNYSVTFINPMSDSTFWLGTKVGPNSVYQRMGPDSTLLHSIILSTDVGSSYTGVSHSGHFNDQSAIFGGITQRSTTQGTALYFCKIDSIGTPYNPVYPPVGPVLTSNQRQNQEPNLQVYPNPFTNTLRLSHKGTAQLLDVHGRVILSQSVEAGEELKVGNLPKGMYLLRLQSVGGRLYVRKVVRE